MLNSHRRILLLAALIKPSRRRRGASAGLGPSLVAALLRTPANPRERLPLRRVGWIPIPPGGPRSYVARRPPQTTAPQEMGPRLPFRRRTPQRGWPDRRRTR